MKKMTDFLKVPRILLVAMVVYIVVGLMKDDLILVVCGVLWFVLYLTEKFMNRSF